MTHKWADEIKAWLDGKVLEYRSDTIKAKWVKFEGNLLWFENQHYKFRVSPDKKTMSEVYGQASGFAGLGEAALEEMRNNGLRAVIEAYKNGTLSDYSDDNGQSR